MRRRVCLAGITFSILVVWGGALVLSSVKGQPLDFGAEFLPRVFLTAVTAAPFLLTVAILGERLRAGKAASWVATAILLLGSIAVWSFLFYESMARRFGRTGGSQNSGLLLLLAPVWLTLISVAGFYITDRVLRSANRPRL